MMSDILTHPVLLCAILFSGMLLCLECGRRLGRQRMARDPDADHAGTAVLDNAIFGLFGLLVAFTFYGAAARFDVRRDLIVNEANAIGTAYLRVDLVPAGLQPALRDDFRRYADSRIEVYEHVADPNAFKVALAQSAEIQNEIWRKAIAAGSREDAQPAVNVVLLPALNEMIDITTTRAMATKMHPSAVVFAMLIGLALSSSLLAGYGMAGTRMHNWLHSTCFAAIASMAIYVILDYEFPRLGLIKVDAFDHVLRDARASMK